MSMSAAQSSAFQAAGGFPPTASYALFVGFAVAITFLWGAWAIYSTYRGWATGASTVPSRRRRRSASWCSA